MRGFTLFETIIVIGLIMILAGLGATLSFAYLRGQRLNASAETIVAEIAQARSDAYTQTDDRAHGVMVFPDHVVRFEGSSYAARIPALDKTIDLPGTVVVSGLTEIVFPAASLQPLASGELTIEDGSQFYVIRISPYGVVEWEKGTE